MQKNHLEQQIEESRLNEWQKSELTRNMKCYVWNTIKYQK
jgi:hypothetical protein